MLGVALFLCKGGYDLDELPELAPEDVEAVLVFHVRGAQLALRAADVNGLLAVQPPTRIPHAPSYVLGLVRHGERALAVVDAAALLGLEGQPVADGEAPRRIIVVSAGGMEVGLLCDRAAGIQPTPRRDWRPRSVLQGEQLAAHVSSELEGPGGIIGLLDLPALLDAARIRT